jgi:YidC/Oxa1 family membrane protein insertase
MLKAIAKPFGLLMLWLYEWTGSYGLAIILFGVLVSLILLPFMAKSKKSMMRTSRLQPRIAELQRRHEGNQQKLNEEMSKLYREEKVNPMSGCLWSLIPFPILLALYYAIRFPITTMMGVPEALMAEGGAIAAKLQELGYSLANYTTSNASAYEQIFQSKFITEHFDQFSSLSDKLIPMDYSFLGLDMTAIPSWKVWTFDFSDPKLWVPALCLFLIPVISAVMSWLSMKISTKMNPASNAPGGAQAAATGKSMEIFMPLMSVWIAFVMPAALGIYWIVNSVLGIIRDVALTKIYTKRMDADDAVRNAERAAREEELERKRIETEAKRAANATELNSNTSKKKMQATQKQKDAERKAAADRAERAARRERLGITEADKPDSQVGNRRYARGRAYVEDRYLNPDMAEEATASAAAESEYGESIDLDMADPDISEETAAETGAPDGEVQE